MSVYIWMAIGVLVLAACLGGKKESRPAAPDGKKEVFRIDHPHYCDLDDYECSVCGARFREKSMVCPECGAKFTDTRTDDTEFMEEMDEEEDWDEEHGDD